MRMSMRISMRIMRIVTGLMRIMRADEGPEATVLGPGLLRQLRLGQLRLGSYGSYAWAAYSLCR